MLAKLTVGVSAILAVLGVAIAFSTGEPGALPPGPASAQACPQFGMEITADYLEGIGLENPALPKGVVESAVIRAVHCLAEKDLNHDRIVQLQLEITGEGEDRDVISVILIGRSDASDRGIGSSALQRIELNNANLEHYEVGENSLLAINLRSRLAAHAAGRAGSAGIDELNRWAR